ncbi:hypothetical protein AK812_SmicGene32615 [Symbiodinium microadriaticum]|uniref:Uncharacterized protein n=1 Tax=Symbiodinium microadriaticum TaxID=2951 RepID=A0A1Q9CTN4_SYMMI|nr:hypothetical protein AK812_SmicGene32615 [Symbiodinium microadriaticum]
MSIRGHQRGELSISRRADEHQPASARRASAGEHLQADETVEHQRVSTSGRADEHQRASIRASAGLRGLSLDLLWVGTNSPALRKTARPLSLAHEDVDERPLCSVQRAEEDKANQRFWNLLLLN